MTPKRMAQAQIVAGIVILVVSIFGFSGIIEIAGAIIGVIIAANGGQRLQKVKDE